MQSHIFLLSVILMGVTFSSFAQAKDESASADDRLEKVLLQQQCEMGDDTHLSKKAIEALTEKRQAAEKNILEVYRKEGAEKVLKDAYVAEVKLRHQRRDACMKALGVSLSYMD